MKSKLLITIAFLVTILLAPAAAYGEGSDTIGTLDQFKSTTSPISAITQRTPGKKLVLTGYGSGCAQFTATGTLTSTGTNCGSGSGSGTSSPSVGRSGNIQFASTTAGQFAATNSLYWDASNARLGVNNTAPEYTIDATGNIRSLADNDATLPRGIISAQYDNAGNPPLMMFFAAGGTKDAPTAVYPGRTVSDTLVEVYDGVGFIHTAQNFYQISPNAFVEQSSAPTDWVMDTGSINGGTDHLRLTYDGKLGVGSGGSVISNPVHALDVAGYSGDDVRGATSGIFSLSDLNTSTVSLQAGVTDTGAWLSARDHSDKGGVYNLFLNKNGGNITIGTSTDYGCQLFVADTVNGVPGLCVGDGTTIDDGLNVSSAFGGTAFSVGTNGHFQVSESGNFSLINNVPTFFPSSQGATSSLLQNDGSGNLSWVASSTLFSNKAAVPLLTGTSTQYLGLTATKTLNSITPAATSTWEVGGNVTITAISANTLNLQVVYTDETNTSRTVSFFPQGLTSASLAATGVYTFPVIQVRAKGGTSITTSVVATGVGSETYDAGATIKLISGN